MNRDATPPAANNSARMLPRIATTALAVTPTGLLMRIIYFFIEFLVVRRAEDMRWWRALAV
jgi:hypothetical protein